MPYIDPLGLRYLAVTLADLRGYRPQQTDEVEVRAAVAITMHVSECDDTAELCPDPRLLKHLTHGCLRYLLTLKGQGLYIWY